MTTRFALILFATLAALVALDLAMGWGLSLDFARWLSRIIGWMAFWR